MRSVRGLVRGATLPVVMVVLAMALTACPSASENGSSGGQPADTPTPTPTETLGGEPPVVTLKLDMRDIAYGAEELRAPAGSVFALEFRNRGVIEHDFTIEEYSGDASDIALGDERFDVHVLLKRGKSGTLLLRVPESGTIAFFCSVAGHREVGMEGVLVIE